MPNDPGDLWAASDESISSVCNSDNKGFGMCDLHIKPNIFDLVLISISSVQHYLQT